MNSLAGSSALNLAQRSRNRTQMKTNVETQTRRHAEDAEKRREEILPRLGLCAKHLRSRQKPLCIVVQRTKSQ